MPSAVTPVVVTPELAAAALASEVMTTAGDPDVVVLRAWLRALAMPLGISEDARTQWLGIDPRKSGGPPVEDRLTAGFPQARDVVPPLRP